MMAPYSLTRSEVWALSTLLYLPIQPNSVVCDWLAIEDAPQGAALPVEIMASLSEKGIYFPENTMQPILPDLVRCLTLVTVNTAEIDLIIRRGGQAALTRFAQVGKGLVQFGMDGSHLWLNPIEDLAAITGNLIPKWFEVSQFDRQQSEMPLNSFLLFKQACIEADLGAGETGFGSEVFEKQKLFEHFNPLQETFISLSSERASRVDRTGKEQVDEHLQILLGNGFLKEGMAATLEIGAVGKGLAEVLSDPDLCSLTISLVIPGSTFPETGVFLYGNGRLYFIEIKAGKIFLRQLADRMDGFPWLNDLLVKGSQAYYTDYIIPPIQ